ncbi:unnamed protein product [Paramecium sonneborni]|uniref:Uncharacterized protein n=1 Tax=Paramecium sonneborni TaxID=65129 RepID=A0A8S1RAH2_9CILI|nr:unnamed protein product [Paramecium sonneborni]
MNKKCSSHPEIIGKRQFELKKYFEKQQKFITQLVEKQNKILSENISKAIKILNQQSVLNNQSIDNFIIFTTMNDKKQQFIENQYSQINQILESQFNYEIKELEFRVSQISTFEFQIHGVPDYEKEQFLIHTVEKKNFKCELHGEKKNYICTHQDCLKQQEYLCYVCASINHQKHIQDGFIKKYHEVKKQQNDLHKIINVKKNDLKRDVKEKIDTQLKVIQQEKLDKCLQFEEVKENLKILEVKITNLINKSPTYIYKKINQDLLGLDDEMIEKDFQNKKDELSQLIINSKFMNIEQFNNSIESYVQEIPKYKQEIEKLHKQAEQKEIQIQDLQNELKNNSIQKKIEQIHNSQQVVISQLQFLKEAQTEQEKSLNQQFATKLISLEQSIKSINEISQIKSLLEDLGKTTQKSDHIRDQKVLDLQQNIKKSNDKLEILSSLFKSFNIELKKIIYVSKDEINKINTEIQKLQETVTESNQIEFLQQDLIKNSKTLDYIKEKMIPDLKLVVNNNSNYGIAQVVNTLTHNMNIQINKMIPLISNHFQQILGQQGQFTNNQSSQSFQGQTNNPNSQQNNMMMSKINYQPYQQCQINSNVNNNFLSK